MLVGPALLLFATLMLYPLVNMFWVSLLDWRGIVKPSTFTGLDNYTKMFGDDKFYAALKNTIIHLAISMPGVIVPSFVLGYFLSQRRLGYRPLRTIFFMPAMLAVPAIAMLFLGLYLPDGIVNTVLRFVGLDSLTRVWLANVDTSLGAVIVIDLWAGIGFYTVLFFAAHSTVPQSVYEAATLDGAGHWTMQRRIALPLLMDFVGVMMMLHLTWILLGSAQNVLLLTKGGPGSSSLTLGYFLYDRAFNARLLGYSQAIGTFVFAVGLAGMWIIRRLTRRDYQY